MRAAARGMAAQPGRVVRRLSRQLGRRGAILLSYGTVWILYGYGQLVQPQPDTRGIRLLLELRPLSWWAVAWIVSGAAAAVAAWMPGRRDWWGYPALLLIVLPWTLAYAASWWPLGIFPRGWVASLIWTVITVPVAVVAGWDESPRRKRIEG